MCPFQQEGTVYRGLPASGQQGSREPERQLPQRISEQPRGPSKGQREPGQGLTKATRTGLGKFIQCCQKYQDRRVLPGPSKVLGHRRHVTRPPGPSVSAEQSPRTRVCSELKHPLDRTSVSVAKTHLLLSK